MSQIVGPQEKSEKEYVIKNRVILEDEPRDFDMIATLMEEIERKVWEHVESLERCKSNSSPVFVVRDYRRAIGVLKDFSDEVHTRIYEPLTEREQTIEEEIQIREFEKKISDFEEPKKKSWLPRKAIEIMNKLSP